MFYANNVDKNADTDEVLNKVVASYDKKINEKDDDGLLIIAGTTGTGKSNLMLHIEEKYLKEKSSINYIAFTRNDLADIQYEIQQLPKPRFLAYDEANVSKRDSLSKWNKDLIDLYLANRGKNIFNVWCNPTVDYLDKVFIKDRVSGVIIVVTKSIDRPRIYYYFTKKRLLELLTKFGNLELEMLKKNAHRYALYCGWFKEYKGVLLKEYLAKKNARMEDKSLYFKNKYGTKVRKEDLLSIQKIADTSLISYTVLKKNKDRLIDEGLLIKDKHYFVLPSGHVGYSSEAIEIFKQNITFNKIEKLKKRMETHPIYNNIKPNSQNISKLGEESLN